MSKGRFSDKNNMNCRNSMGFMGLSPKRRGQGSNKAPFFGDFTTVLHLFLEFAKRKIVIAELQRYRIVSVVSVASVKVSMRILGALPQSGSRYHKRI